MSVSVLVEPSGHRFVVHQGETVLDAALRQGVALPYGCRNGSCGSCRGKVLEGECRYEDELPPGISEAEAENGMALFCQARPTGSLRIEVREARGVQDIEVRTLPCRVVKLEHLARDVIRLYLKLPETERLQFLAGQYIDILLRSGERRAFSLANAPHDDRYLELHLRHVKGGKFTDFVFSQMKEKALLRFEGPLGSFYLREDSDRPLIFVAGGTGFAPIKGIIEHALAEGITRPMHLYWGVRGREDLYLDDLARIWSEEHRQLSYVPVLSEPDPGDLWSGATGLVHEAVLADFADLSPFEVYASGPPPMVAAVRQSFPTRGLDPAHLFADSFEFAHATAKT